MELIYNHTDPFVLESGAQIEKLTMRYQMYGKPNASQNNVVWVFHALTANADVHDWWAGLFGAGAVLDIENYCVICANVIGSPYGSTAPQDLDFPNFTVRDVVNAQLILADYLGVRRIKIAIGGSFGGSQAMEFAYSFAGHIDQLILLACTAQETAWGIASHEAQRMALLADQTFSVKGEGKSGLRAARAIGMLTYRSVESMIKNQTGLQAETGQHKASSYLQYQSQKFVDRFDAICYYYLSHCMDTHDIGRGRGGVEKVLAQLDMPTLVLGVPNDLLIPYDEIKKMAQALPHSYLVPISSIHGHDGFLIETEKISKSIRRFIDSNKKIKAGYTKAQGEAKLQY